MAADAWRVWIDTGGTFTDCVALSPDGEMRRRKVLSSGKVRARLLAGSTSAELRIATIVGTVTRFFDGFLAEVAGWGVAPVIRHECVRSEGKSGAETQVSEERSMPHDILRVGDREHPIEALEEDLFFSSGGRWVELSRGLEAPSLGLHLLFGVAPGEALPNIDLRLGTTRGTNALLERKGARCAFVVSKGFSDLIEIGDQSRPDLFALEIVKPVPLYSAVIEVEERLAADGKVIAPLDCGRIASLRFLDESEPRDVTGDGLPSDIGDAAELLVEKGFDSAAIAFVHSYAFPSHERHATESMEEAGLTVSSSSTLSNLAGFLARAQTAVVDAYLAPLLGDYLAGIADNLEGPFLVMSSAGGLVSNLHFCAKDSLLSGPAGGVVGCAEACRLAGVGDALAFDMGGTSTDVSRLSGDLEYDQQHQVAGATVVAPALAIRTVAAGGGSICMVKNGQLRVGPESAGAEPGPACYGRGGPLTVTDVNLLLGRIDGARFEVPLDLGAARIALEAELARVEDIEQEQLLEGFLAVANERMAETIRRISTRRGYDPKDHTLVAFGGAGGQHACGLAELLGISRVLVPEDCSLLSARGIGAAHLERFVQRQVLMSPDSLDFKNLLDDAEKEARRRVLDEFPGTASRDIEISVAVRLRYQGQDSGIEVPAYPLETLAHRFVERYQSVFGYTVDRAVDVEWSRTRARLLSPKFRHETAQRSASGEAVGWLRDARTVLVWDGSQRTPVPLVERNAVPVGADRALAGPALITEEYSSTWVPAGWQVCTEAGGGALVLQLSSATVT